MDENKDPTPTPMPERWKQEWEQVCKLLLKSETPAAGTAGGS